MHATRWWAILALPSLVIAVWTAKGAGARKAVSSARARTLTCGVRYHVTATGTDRSLYVHGSAVVSSSAFFSLFQWCAQSGSAPPYALGDHIARTWAALDSDARLGLGRGSGDASNAGNASLAQPFWPVASTAHGQRCYVLHLDEERKTALGSERGEGGPVARVPSDRASVYCFHPVAQPPRGGAQRQHTGEGHRQGYHTSQAHAGAAKAASRHTFAQRVERSTTKLHGRQFVLVTYHNIGMLDWAVLFWRWLRRAGIRRFMLLELDGLTCDAARRLNASLHFECASGRDMTALPRQYTDIADASSMQEWGTDATSGYFKFLRWKLCIVDLLLEHHVDVLMADVDVLVLSRSFFTGFVTSPYDLTISSDARRGRYSDHHHCPCSHVMYQRYAADWICAGLFYLRDTSAARWFMHEVQALMDEYIITDQDAIQAVLTGHTQVAVPQARDDQGPAGQQDRHRVEAIKMASGYRPSPDWMKPIWLEGLHPSQTLRNTRGIQPMNAPMKDGMRQRIEAGRNASGFRWVEAPLMRYANGPLIVEHWNSTFGPLAGRRTVEAASQARARARRQGFVSVHANCFVKEFLAAEANSDSFLLHPPS
jgi:hypothetical protein